MGTGRALMSRDPLAPEDVRPQDLARNAGQALQFRDMVNRDFGPLRRGTAAETERLRHRNDAAELLRGLKDDGISLAHYPVYSTAKHPRSSPAIHAPAGYGITIRVMSLGRKMRAARKAAEKTQDQIADELGVTKGAVSQWETDQTVPELEYFVQFCRYTRASADDILLERSMNPLLRQLVMIWDRLSDDGKDKLLGNANRILSEEQPGPAVHDPFGTLPPGSRAPAHMADQKPTKKHRPS